MESINVFGVLQEAGDANWGAHTRCQVYVEYFIILYTSTFIRLPHLCQEFYIHCIAIINDGRMAKEGGGAGLIYIRLWVRGAGVGIIL